MDGKKRLQERTELFNNVYDFKHNKRVPTLTNASLWPIFEAGLNYRTYDVYDQETMERIHDHFYEKYQFDAYHAISVGFLSGFITSEILKTDGAHTDPSGETFYTNDFALMQPDELQEWMDDGDRFDWTKAFQRMCAPGLTMGQLKETIRLTSNCNAFLAKMEKKYIEEYGALVSAKICGGWFIPFEVLFNKRYRGMKEASMDLRRRKDQLKEMSDVYFERNSMPQAKRFMGSDPTGYVAPIRMNMLAHSIMNRKQFEELYWPYLKRVLDEAARTNKHVFLYVEAAILRFADFFRDIPQGTVLMQLESDNMYDTRKALPNIALCGGMPVELLGRGTAKECVDKAKELIDTMGDGFVLGQNKLLAYRNDAQPENLEAVQAFARSYEY